MKTIETMGTVNANGVLTVQLPTDVEPGQHRLVLVIDEHKLDQGDEAFDFPTFDLGPWPENLSLRREDMYDDWGR